MRLSCRLALVAALGLAVAALLPLHASAAQPDGKAVYLAKCALCHGKDGAPLPAFAKKNAPDFRNAAWHKRKTDEQIRKSIAEGTPGTMMRPFGKSLSPAEIRALVAHVRALQAKAK